MTAAEARALAQPVIDAREKEQNRLAELDLKDAEKELASLWDTIYTYASHGYTRIETKLVTRQSHIKVLTARGFRVDPHLVEGEVTVSWR